MVAGVPESADGQCEHSDVGGGMCDCGAACGGGGGGSMGTCWGEEATEGEGGSGSWREEQREERVVIHSGVGLWRAIFSSVTQIT